MCICERNDGDSLCSRVQYGKLVLQAKRGQRSTQSTRKSDSEVAGEGRKTEGLGDRRTVKEECVVPIPGKMNVLSYLYS